MGVAVGGLHLDHALAHLQDRDVEGAAAEVVDRDHLVLLLVQPVGEGGRRGLVDDPHHLQPGDLPRVLGGLALGVVEVGGRGDDRLGHLLAQVVLGRLLQLLQDHGRDLRRRVLFLHGLHSRVPVRRPHHLVGHHLNLFADLLVAAAHEALDREDGVLRVGDRLPLGHLAHQALARLGEAHHRRSSPAALLVGDDHRLARLHHRHHRVCRSQVNSNDLAHKREPPENC